MDSNNAIEIRNVSKIYKIKVEDKGVKKSFVNKRPMKIIENKVIDDISLDIKKGDVLGVLGRNGSGKSTFLSLLARIMEPDSGTIKRSGKIASILELGMGFHTDMSGRENIYLKGELYGFSKKEIDKRIDRIIEYSGIEKYIDNPVRTYSSGMTGRLAFAIMVNVDSEIMLVDEVLSVGDAVFESKAKEHFKQMSASGKTVVIVSHQIESLESMCNRAIWIEGGKIRKDGDVKKVCSEYQNMINESPEIILDLASAGVANSQYKLGIMYRDGINYPPDAEQYEELMKKAAIQGHTKAQVEYGNILLKKKQTTEAMDFFRKAANKGDNEAKKKIASMCSSNDDIYDLLKIYEKMAVNGSELDLYRYADLIMKTQSDDSYSKAFDLFLRSANKGFPHSMHQVALMYRDGIGTIRDLDKMEQYLIMAAENSFMPSVNLLIDLYSQGIYLPKDEKKVFNWVLKSSELGDTQSMYKLANMYRDGIGTDVNVELSERWFHNYSQSLLFWYKLWATGYVKSIEKESTSIVGGLFKGFETSGNPVLIDNYYSYNVVNNIDNNINLEKMIMIANSGNVEAIRRLGNFYYDGVGVPKDDSVAIGWYRKGASLGDPWCKIRMGDMYRDGRGTERDPDEALRWYFESAAHGSIAAINSIIGMYTSGMIHNKDVYDKAISIFNNYTNSGNI